MSTFRKRPKGDYLEKADWASLYELTQHWKSELLFYKDELRFFHRLIENYFIWMTLGENLDAVRELEMDLLDADKNCEDLSQKVVKHLTQLAETVENPKNGLTRVFRMEHGNLEDDISHFAKTFKIARKDVMAVTEHVLQSEHWIDLKHHLAHPNVA